MNTHHFTWISLDQHTHIYFLMCVLYQCQELMIKYNICSSKLSHFVSVVTVSADCRSVQSVSVLIESKCMKKQTESDYSSCLSLTAQLVLKVHTHLIFSWIRNFLQLAKKNKYDGIKVIYCQNVKLWCSKSLIKLFKSTCC